MERDAAMTPADPTVGDVVVGDPEREHAAGVLQRVCGEGRITLEEFTVRVGAVWAADRRSEIDRALDGVALHQPPPVPPREPESKIVNVLGENRRSGRWLLPRRLRLINVLGETKLDLREAALAPEVLAERVVDITGRCVLGEVTITVPEGIEVEVSGGTILGSRKLRLPPVRPAAGTPVVRIHLHVFLGEVKIRSAGPGSHGTMPRWARELLGG